MNLFETNLYTMPSGSGAFGILFHWTSWQAYHSFQQDYASFQRLPENDLLRSHIGCTSAHTLGFERPVQPVPIYGGTHGYVEMN